MGRLPLWVTGTPHTGDFLRAVMDLPHDHRVERLEGLVIDFLPPVVESCSWGLTLLHALASSTCNKSSSRSCREEWYVHVRQEVVSALELISWVYKWMQVCSENTQRVSASSATGWYSKSITCWHEHRPIRIDPVCEGLIPTQGMGDNPSNDLHSYDSIPVPVVCLVFFPFFF